MTRRVTLRTLARALWLGAFAAPGLAAQAGSPGSQVDTAHADTAQQTPLFTPVDAVIAAGFVGATVALFPVDERVAKSLQDPNTQANQFFKNASNGFEIIASPGALIIGGTLYVVGRAGDYPRVADLGWHGTEAVLIATAITGVLKRSLGRARPVVSAGTNPRDFDFGSGFNDDLRQSFPSGHSTTAFAAASAVTSEARRWWPDRWWSTWLVGPVMYGGATMVGLSRIYHNDHWASDIALGAAIGTFSGLKVVRYSHSHPRNRIDRILLHTSLAPDGLGGVVFGWSLGIP